MCVRALALRVCVCEGEKTDEHTRRKFHERATEETRESFTLEHIGRLFSVGPHAVTRSLTLPPVLPIRPFFHPVNLSEPASRDIRARASWARILVDKIQK